MSIINIPLVVEDIDSWSDDAACKVSVHPSSWWYPEKDWSHLHPYVKAALAVCKECPVRQKWLGYSLVKEPYGIWGGMTEQQRETYRRHNNLPLLRWRN
jgi:WhiB family redox-sensing transcriptional regulator